MALTWVRTVLWHWYKRATTAIYIRTGLYRLYIVHGMSSQKLYEMTMDITTKKKDEAKQRILEKRVQERQKQEKKQNGATQYPQESLTGDKQSSNSNGTASSSTTTGMRRGRWWNRLHSRSRRGAAELGEGGLQGNRVESGV